MMEDKKNKLRAVYSLRCAGYLMYHGISIVAVRPLKENERRNIYFFLDDDKTDKMIQEYIKNK